MKENLHKFLTEGGKFHGEVSLLFIVSLFHIFPFSNQNQIQRFMCYDHTFCYWLPPFWIQDMNRTYTRRLENIQHVMHVQTYLLSAECRKIWTMKSLNLDLLTCRKTCPYCLHNDFKWIVSKSLLTRSA